MDPEFYKNLLTIPQKNFQSALTGGLIIALASTMYYLFFGNILGMSGLLGSLIKFPLREATRAKIIVLAGLIFSSALIHFLYQQKQIQRMPFDSNSFTQSTLITRLIISGALVGLGTEFSNGCTSGHGLCGMPRFSLRSFVAVIVFLLTAIATATFSLFKLIPQIPELNSLPNFSFISLSPLNFLAASIAITLVLFVIDSKKYLISKISLFVIGFIFGSGLMIAGMSQRTKIYAFLQLNKNWDPSLLVVLMTGVLINAITFNLIKRKVQKPIFGQKIQDPRGKIDLKLIIGAFLFGLGWGIGGLCPGPFILSIPNSVKILIYWGVPFAITQKLGNILTSTKHHNDNPKVQIKTA